MSIKGIKSIKIKKIRISFILVLSIFFIFSFNVNAESLQDKYNALAELQKKYNDIKNNTSMTENQLNKINNEITVINKTIENGRKEIKQAEEDIEKSKENIANKKVETDGFIQFLQISNGGNIYLEYLFDAENYTDFIYRYEVVKQLTNYNSNLIDELENLIIELQQKEKDLKEKNIKLDNDRKELTKKINSLTTTLKSYKTEGVDIKKDIEDKQKDINKFEELYKKNNCPRDMDEFTCIGKVIATGWKYPLLRGCVTSEYTGFNQRYDYSGGWGHHAIDVDCVGEGTNVYSAAAGTIARIARYDCGGNAVYINHWINGKAYTTVYMHLLSVANGIYVGKNVTDQTVIGYVGGYSTSTAHGGYDSCTTGAHLHFGIAEGHKAWDFNSYSINPREVLSFPKLVYSGGGYFSR